MEIKANRVMDSGGNVLVQGEDVYLNRHEGLLKLPVKFRPDAKAPRWELFLKEIFPGEDGKQKAETLQKYFGYCLMRECFHGCFLVLAGAEASGKSLIISILEAMIGKENCASVYPYDFNDFRSPQKLSSLQGKVVNACHEIFDLAMDRPRDIELFKLVVSGGPVYSSAHFEFRPSAKHIYASNGFGLTHYGPATCFGRMLLLIFGVSFTGPDRDPVLYGYLRDELDGIFLWSLRGMNLLVEHGSFAYQGGDS